MYKIRYIKLNKLHRKDGPAVEYSNGKKWWYINGLLHRENSPAIEYANGIKKWVLYGVSYTEQEYKLKIRSIKLTKLIK